MVDTRDTWQDLFDLYLPIGIGVFVLITLLVVIFAVRYRDRGPEHELPRRTRTHFTGAEGSYLVVLALITAVLVYFTFSEMGEDRANLPAEASGSSEVIRGGTEEGESGDDVQPAPAGLRVKVTSARWTWRFDYPDLGITQTPGGEGAIATLVVPAGVNVRFDLTSLDVIHSFYIPRLRFKRDAFPERVTSFTLGFGEPGVYRQEGKCAEFCGLLHGDMLFNLVVLEQGAFRDWVAGQRGGGDA
ncbi:MAG TPA: cytochrome c oxidase subunit II [Solirubrobacteraceae bacterium]|nr:cytochrome c oxidase subunit II [Solirubrobacteraceae bacterium]